MAGLEPVLAPSRPQLPRPPGVAPIPARAGIGLRFQHHREVVERRPDVAWLEVHAENYMGGGPTPAILDRIRRDYALSLHGVGLSLGSAQGLSAEHLRRLAQVVDRYAPGLVSEHLSWSVVDGIYLADLLPLPLTQEALAVVCRNVEQAQEALGRRLLVENPSSYLRYVASEIPEWEFLAAVARRTGCGILFDVNNLHVSACNHGWSATEYLEALPQGSIGEFHLAGHSVRELEGGRQLRIDDHGSRVRPEVWQLFERAVARFGSAPALIEWDTDVPALEVLIEEAGAAQRILDHVSHESRRALPA